VVLTSLFLVELL